MKTETFNEAANAIRNSETLEDLIGNAKDISSLMVACNNKLHELLEAADSEERCYPWCIADNAQEIFRDQYNSLQASV